MTFGAEGLSLVNMSRKWFVSKFGNQKQSDDMIASDIHKHLVSRDYELRSWAVFSAIYVKKPTS